MQAVSDNRLLLIKHFFSCYRIGPIFLLLGNQKVNEAVESAPGTVSSAFTDLTNFVNDTVKVICFVYNL